MYREREELITMMNQLRMTARKFHQPLKALAAGAVAFTLLADASSVQAFTYNWTNSAATSFLDDTNVWNPVGGPGGPADTFTIAKSGTFYVQLTNNFSNIGIFMIGAAAANQQINLTLDFGTNNFSGLTGGTGVSGASDAIFGQAGTTVVYVAVGTLYITNSSNSGRLTLGRSGGAPAQFNLTNGTVVAQATIMANNIAATPSKLVITGAGSSWTNGGLFSIGNAASANFNSLTVSNSGSMTVMGSFTAGAQGTSHSNSVLVDTSGRLFTRNTAAFGGGSGSLGNTITVQGGGLWDAGNLSSTLGAGGGSGNGMVIGNNGVVSNIQTVTLFTGNFLKLSNGFLNVKTAVTNTSGTVSGSGTIAGNVVFVGTGTLTPSAGTIVGTLNISNNLTLLSTSTTIIRLDSSQTGSNDAIIVGGTATIAGTLTVVTNGVAPLAAGDVYNIGITGGFATTNLPALLGSLRWNNVTPGILAIVPQEVVPGVTGLTNQIANIGDTVVISGTVTGVPTPGVYWQFNNVNVTNGAQPDGSTNSGSATTTLTISNAQTNETGTFCLIATNSVGVSTNCMGLTVSSGCSVAPSISGVSDQTVVQGNNGTFNAAVSGCPVPSIQWFENGATITGATGVPLVLTNVQFAQDGFVYTIVASNSFGVASTNLTLHVIICPSVQTQPQSLAVTNTQSASFTVVSTNGIPAPTYQWFFNNSSIGSATSATYTIASAVASNEGTYRVQISNAACSISSSNATLLVNSTMAATLTPSNSATAVCYDTPLYMAFDRQPFSTSLGKIQIFNVTNSVTPVDTIDTSLGNLQSRTIGTESFATYPVIITGNTVAIYPHLGVLSSNQTYFVTVDRGIFTDTNSTKFAGISGTNGWQFTTKPTGPANPNNVIVAADGSGDFCTVQGTIDSLPANNTTHTLVNIRNGTYTEVVDTKTKNNITFRGQNRIGTVVQYANNNNNNGTTHSRMAFKVFSNDIAVENLTINNTTPQGGTQAEALMIDSPSARFILNNADVNSRQDTVLANANSSQGYFYNSLVRGNFDYVWGGGNCYFTKCTFLTIPTASSYNLTASRTDNAPFPPGWQGFDLTHWSSNGLSFVRCQMLRADNSITNITMAGSNGNAGGLASFAFCSIDTNCYRPPTPAVYTNQILWEYSNSNLDNTASASFGLTALTNGDLRLDAVTNVVTWLYGWSPQLAPNILTNPVSLTVTAGVTATFSVSATGIPDPTYQWLVNGTNYVNATSTSATLVISNALASDAGVYSVLVSNIAGTVTSGGATLTIVGTGPSASFTATPTSGTEPLAVTFTDTSTGSPNITAFWDLGDATTTNTAGGASFTHSYAAGIYTVTLTASNAFGANSTIVSNNLITVITAFQAWQNQYFGSTTNPAAAANADPDGDGQNNLAEFLAGTNPTNSASGLHITSVVPSGSDVVITWSTAGGTTNVVQSTAGNGNGGYSTNFADLSGPIVITGSGDVITNYTDTGGATNVPSRYYRVRLAP
jgi:PKD repeat protein